MYIGKGVRVIALFDPSTRLRPLKFNWSGRLIHVKEVTYTWQSRRGEGAIYHFSLTDGDVLYELSYDSRTLLWKLENIEA